MEDVTGVAEMLDGRVKTLHPAIHGGILYQRSNPEHQKTVEDNGITGIDIVAVNLYPFVETLKKPGVSTPEMIEQIDIGGPAMIRAAAKNYTDVTVLVDTADYDTVLDDIRLHGTTTLETRKRLAGKAFSHTAFYDSQISAFFNEENGVDFPDTITFGYEFATTLRYGENPHQNAAYYVNANPASPTTM